jgi:DNA-directed RNA polymerase specialized sigma24 family protein
MDDQALLAAAASGDADAFAAFYRRHLGLVVGFGLRSTGDPEAAADLAGEVFATALAKCGRYHATHETAAPWLIGIAHNKLRESNRRGRVQDGVRRRFGIRPLVIGDGDLDRVIEMASTADGSCSRRSTRCRRPSGKRSADGSWTSAPITSLPPSWRVLSRSCASASVAACDACEKESNERT